MKLSDLSPVDFTSILTKSGNWVTLGDNQAWQQVGKCIELWQEIDGNIHRVKRYTQVVAVYE